VQGIKRGIVELAQLVLVNKADGDLLPAARRSAAEVISALKILRPMREIWNPKVVLLSAREKQGIDKAWDAMCEFREAMQVRSVP
jgi:LAO/AO transport system kinase